MNHEKYYNMPRIEPKINIDTPVDDSAGLNKREYFAAMAMQGLLANGFQIDDTLCKKSWDAADLMLSYQEQVLGS